MKKIFGNSQVREEHCVGFRSTSNAGVYVDIFIPKHNLAIEYQGAFGYLSLCFLHLIGEQHYYDAMPHTLPTTMFEARDFEKMSICESAGSLQSKRYRLIPSEVLR